MDNLALEINENDFKNISRNLRLLFTERDISESMVAQALNIPVITIKRIISGETTDPRISTLKMIADYFNVSIDSLMSHDNERSTALMNKNVPIFIPVLDWQTIINIHAINELDLKSWKNWHPISLIDQSHLGNHIFALESRPSMQPRYPLGTLFVIDPDEKPTDGDIVLIKMRKDKGISLRELVIDLPRWQLQPVVTGSETLFYEKNEHDIIGVVILTLLYTKKKTTS